MSLLITDNNGEAVLQLLNWTCPDLDFLIKARSEIDQVISIGQDGIDSLNRRIYDSAQEYDNTPTPPKEIDRSGHVYILLCKRTGLHKIGATKNFENRIKQLKTANADIETVAVYNAENARQSERFLQDTLSKFRIDCEWFGLTSEQLYYIEKHFNTPL